MSNEGPRWLADYPDLTFDAARRKLRCEKCDRDIEFKKYCAKRHVETTIHRSGRRPAQSDFYLDLIQFLILCNIPWSQVNNQTFKNFFTKYFCANCCCTCADRGVPDESLLRKVYLDKFFTKSMQSIQERLNNEKLWISLDETTDFLGRNVVHFLIRPLSTDHASKPYLFACKVLNTVNSESITQFVVDCLEQLWPNSFEFSFKVNNVLMLCTDGAAYMTLAGKKLKILFLPNLIHVTCLAHALHRVSEEVRSNYPLVDKLITNVKKIFLKAPSRARLLKQLYPAVPMPPKPVTTRWGTWLEAASYYFKYFVEIKDVILRLNSSDSQAIQNAKTIFENLNVQGDLQFIDQYYSILIFSIKELEKKDLQLHDSLLAIDQARAVLNWSGSQGMINKIETVLNKNPGLEIIREYSLNLEKGIATDDMKYFKYAPLTSVDVERSFSTYKWALQVKRNRLSVENIEKIMLIYFNCRDGSEFFEEEDD